jgi:hypothetical protein
MHPDMVYAAIVEQARKIAEEKANIEAAKGKKKP